MKASFKKQPTSANLTATDQHLGYITVAPPKSEAVKVSPAWVEPSDDPIAMIIQDIIEEARPVAKLREQIRHLGGKPKGRTRAKLAAQMVELLMDQERVQGAVGALSSDAKEYFTYLLLYTSLGEVYNVSRTFKTLHAFSTPLDVLEQELLAVGLILEPVAGHRLPSYLSYVLPPLYLTLPDYEQQTVPASRQAEFPGLIQRVQQFISVVQANARPLRSILRWNPREIGNVHYLRENIVPTQKSARQLLASPTKQAYVELLPPEPLLDDATLTKWSKALGLPEVGVEFFYHVLSAAGVLRPGSPVAVEPQLVQDFLTLPAEEQVAVLFRYFRTLPNWAAFWPVWREGQLKAVWHYRLSYWNSFPYETVMAETLQALRQAILSILAFLPHDVWLPVNAAERILLTFLPDDKALTLASPLLTFSHAETDWEGFLSIYLEALLRGPLHWLGLVDFAPAGDDKGIKAFRLRYLQDVFLGRSDRLPKPDIAWTSQDAVHLMPDQGLLLLDPPVPIPVIQHIETWAEPVGISGRAMQYRQSLQRLHTAFESGLTPESLENAWESSTGFSPPDALREWWTHWWERYGQVWLYPHQALLSVRDDFALQELQVALPEMQEALLGLITSKVALLRQDELDQVIEAMEAKGYMPKEEF